MNINVFKSLLVLGVIFITCACQNETWDEHYNPDAEHLDGTVLDAIMNDDSLKIFAEYLHDTGYDSVLINSNAYTVWAPVNDAFTNVPQATKDDPALLKALIANHISFFSYTSTQYPEDGQVKMMNNKNVAYEPNGSSFTFGDVTVIEGDILANNGILHKIDEAVPVRLHIWNYLLDTDRFPMMMDYLTQFNFIDFDEANSIATGKNSLGETVYDSVFTINNTYFDIVSPLNDEEKRFSFVALTDDVVKEAFDSITPYFYNPDTALTVLKTEEVVYNNLNFIETDLSLVAAYPLWNTISNQITFETSDIVEETVVSNGTIWELSSYSFDLKETIYKPIRYELEDTKNRTIADPSVFTISKKYDINASGEFYNVVTLSTAPVHTETEIDEVVYKVNDYFEIGFDNVLAADYDLFVKFVPTGEVKNSRVKFDVSYFTKDENGILSETTYSDTSHIINSIDEQILKIADVYSNGVYIENYTEADATKTLYNFKVKMYMDVSDAAKALYSRTVGIDYIELTPAMPVDTIIVDVPLVDTPIE